MDLHGIVRSHINAVNPDTPGFVQVSSGYTTQEDGKQVPKYEGAKEAIFQVQPLSTGQLRQSDGLNIQGVRKKFYVHGVLNGIVRPHLKGGDLCVINNGPNKGVWLVAQNLEQWPDWCLVEVVLQNQQGIQP